MAHELYWIIPLCLILGLLFRRQLGWIFLGLLMLIWWCSKSLKRVIAAPFILAWNVASLPVRAIWCWTSGYHGIDYAMRVQWERDMSIFFAKWILTFIAMCLYVKGGIYLFTYFHK
jgi:hypothetical protein